MIPPFLTMNYLLQTDYINIWKSLTDKELIALQDTLVTKINLTTGSPAVTKSITDVLEILEDYMQKREIF